MSSLRLEVPFAADGRGAPCAALCGALQGGRSAEATPGTCSDKSFVDACGHLWRSGAPTVAPKLEAWLNARWRDTADTLHDAVGPSECYLKWTQANLWTYWQHDGPK